MAINLFVVEDEESFRTMLALAFNLEGYAVKLVANGEQAIAALPDITPDLIILDLSMPDIDGWQVLDSIRGWDHLAHTPVIVLTALAEEQTRSIAMAKGVTKLLIKPIEIELILSAIRDALN